MAIENKKEKIKVAIVDVTSKTENEARDLAESKMTADKEELKGFRGLCKRIWKHNLARGWYIRREYDKARENIVSQKNIYANEGAGRNEHEDAMKATADRFISEYEEAVHGEAGEQKEKIGDSEIEKEIKSEIKRMVMEYALQDLSQKDSRENFENEKNAIFSRIKGAKRDVVGKGDLFADNLFEVVKQVQQSLEQGKKLDELDLDFEVVVGRAKDRVRTEAQYNAVDRIMEKITHSKYGFLVNEAALASALSVVYCGGGKIIQGFSRSRLLKWATFGATAVLGSGMAALRERQMFEEDRKRHLRDIAQGKHFDLKKKPKRAEMEALRYEAKNANYLAENLERELYTYNEKGERQIRELSREEIQNILNNLSEIEARTALSDRMKIDLISYSSKNKTEQEGLRLDLLRAQSKVDLEKYFQNNQKLAGELLGGRSFKDFLKSLNETKIESLIKGEAGIEAKNRIAKKMKQKKVAWAAVKGLGMGLAFGAIAQEVKAILGGEETSLIGQLFGMKEAHAAGMAGTGAEPQKYTALGYFYRYMTGSFPRMDMQNMQDFVFGEQHFNLPKGASLLKNPDGTLQLLRGKEVFVDHIPVDAKGHLTPEGKALLASHDVKISGPGIGGPGHSQELVPKDYIEKNKGMFRHIFREKWFDNDTPKPIFDKNELKLDWGGKGGIDSQGRYVFNIKRMVPEGSYHKNLSVNAQEAMKSGKLKMLLSLSRDTQCDVVEVPIDANGNMVVDPNSEVGKTFFEKVPGRELYKNNPRILRMLKAKGLLDEKFTVFKGKFAEVAEMMGEKNGVDQVKILATHVGKGATGVKWTPPVIFDMPAPVTVEPPPFIPIVARRPLERPDHPPSPDTPPHEPYSGEKLKRYYTELLGYRNSDRLMGDLLFKMQFDPRLRTKYDFVLNRLAVLKNYPHFIAEQQESLEKELFKNNKLRQENLDLKEYAGREIQRIYYQIENILIEEAKTGEKPFPPEFYSNSPIIKGISESEEVVLVLDDPIGDAVLTTPVLSALDAYFKRNTLKKKVKVVAFQPELLESLKDQYDFVDIVDQKKTGEYFSKEGNKKRFIINANKKFEDYGSLGMSGGDVRDLSKVMSVDWSSWQREEVPIGKGPKTSLLGYGNKSHEMIPHRILRNFEIMFGQKLFSDIRKENKFMNKKENFEQESQELRDKYKLDQNEEFIVISPGSSIMPKEYSPERWKQVISEICRKHPNERILFLDDPNPAKRDLYGNVVDDLVRENGFKITRVQEGLGKMNTIMSMAKLSITPDTGLGHLSAMVGTPNIMLTLVNPMQWSAPETKRVMHSVAHEMYRLRRGSYERLWSNQDSYLISDRGKMIGASNIEPDRIVQAVEKILNRSRA